MTGSNVNTDYNNAKIYKIVSPNCDKVYYGSTVDTLNDRFSAHKKGRACSSVEIIDAGDSVIHEIEKFPCSCEYDLEDREAYFIMNDWKGCVNKYIPAAVRRAGGRKAYDRKRNTPERKEKARQKIICNVCGCIITRGGKSQHQKTKKCQMFLKT